MFITFEGIDGSGKSTQIKLLSERLKQEGIPVEVFREPGGTDLSEAIRKLLLNHDYDIQPLSELLLFSAARAQLIAEKVIPLLEKQTVVILDRFYDSTVAYQGFGRHSLPLDQIHQINKVASLAREPDLTFYLSVDLEEAQKRTAHKRQDRMEGAGAEFYRNVIEGFEALAASEARITTIDGSYPPEKVHEQIWQKILKQLKG